MEHVFFFIDKDNKIGIVKSLQGNAVTFQSSDISLTSVKDIVKDLARYVLVSYWVDTQKLRLKGENPFPGRNWIDLQQLTWPWIFDGALSPSSTLRDVALFFGCEGDDVPTKVIANVYWVVMRRLTTGRVLEEKTRKATGKYGELAQKLLRGF